MAQLHGGRRTRPRPLSTARSNEASKAIDAGYRIYFILPNLAAAHAFKGEMDEAKSALAEARRLYPKLSDQMVDRAQAESSSPLFEVLRKAGLPEE